MFVDNTKHAFITKFNNIPSKVYREYTALLANDVITSRKKNVSNVSCTVCACMELKYTLKLWKAIVMECWTSVNVNFILWYCYTVIWYFKLSYQQPSGIFISCADYYEWHIIMKCVEDKFKVQNPCSFFGTTSTFIFITQHTFINVFQLFELNTYFTFGFPWGFAVTSTPYVGWLIMDY